MPGMIVLLVSTAFADDVGEQVRTQLSLRDGFGGCDALWALGDATAVRDALLEASKAERPPWMPMRAAECVVEHADEDPLALDAAKGWMADPAVPGLALVVVQNLDELTEPKAVELAELARVRATTDTRFARYAPRTMEASMHPAVREVASRIAKP